MPEINLPTYAQQQAILTKLNNAPKSNELNGFVVATQPDGATEMPNLANGFFTNGNSDLPIFQVDAGYTAYSPLTPSANIMAVSSGSGPKWVSNDNFLVRVESYNPTMVQLKVFYIQEDKTLLPIFNGLTAGASPTTLKIGVFAFIDKYDYLHIFLPAYNVSISKYYYTKLPRTVSSITLSKGDIVGTDIAVDNNIYPMYDKAKNVFKLGVYTGYGNGFVQFDTEDTAVKKAISIQGSNTGTNFKSGNEAGSFIKELDNDYWLTDRDYVLNLNTMLYTKIPSNAPYTEPYSIFTYNNRLYGIKVVYEVAYVVSFTFNRAKQNVDIVPLNSFKVFSGTMHRGYSHRDQVYMSGTSRKSPDNAKYANVVTYNITDKIKEAEAKLA